jgi:hypothetical protein
MLSHLHKLDRTPRRTKKDCHLAHSVTDATRTFGVSIISSDNVVTAVGWMKSGSPHAY